MSTDFETRLREDLAAVEVRIPFDPETALAAGRRARGRRIAGSFGAGAIVVALALFALPFVQRGVPAVPEPIATKGTVTFGHLSVRGAGGIDGATMSVERHAGVLDIAVTVTTSEEGKQVRVLDHPDDGSVWIKRINDQVLAALIPSEVTWVETVADGGWTWDDQRVPGMGLTAVLYASDEPNTAIDALVWRQLDGRVVDSNGNEVSATTVRLGESDLELWADPALDRIGLNHDEGGASGFLSGVGDDLVAIATMHQTGSEPAIARVVFLLPEGAADPSLVVVPDLQTEWTAATLRGGELASRTVVVSQTVLAGGEFPGAAALVSAISYRAADGAQVTRQVG